MAKHEHDEEELDEKKNSNDATYVLIALGALFIPSAIVAAIIFLLLRVGRQRKGIIQLIVLAIVIFSALTIYIRKPFNFVKNSISDILHINWVEFGVQLAPIYLIVGTIAGYVLVLWELREMKNSPHRLQAEGDWMYNFTFRRTPLELRRKKQIIKSLQEDTVSDEKQSSLGYTDNKNEDYEIVSRYVTEAERHTLISGASGSGKTITMQSLIKNDIDFKRPVGVLDLKASPEFASKLAVWTKEAGGTFYHFVNGRPENYNVLNSRGQSFYDPLISGSSGARADMMLGMREYDTASAVYKMNMQQLLQGLFSMLEYADRSKAPNINWAAGGVRQLASAIQIANFQELVDACNGTPIETDANDLYDSIMTRGSQLKHAMGELQGQVRTLLTSEYGTWLNSDPNGNNIKLMDLFSTPGNVVLFSLNSDSEPDFVKFIGSLIMSDITNVSAARRAKQLNNHVGLYIDEFQAINSDSVKSLLEKARESKIAVTLAQQSFEQIIASTPVNGEAYLTSILDTCSNFIIHSGSTHDSAERLSKIIGQDEFTIYSSSTKHNKNFFSWNFSNRRHEDVRSSKQVDWIVPPKKFMQLSAPTSTNNYHTTAMYLTKSADDPKLPRQMRDGAVARKVIMVPSSEILEKYFVPSFDDSGSTGNNTSGNKIKNTATNLSSSQLPHTSNLDSAEENSSLENDSIAENNSPYNSSSNQRAKGFFPEQSNNGQLDNHYSQNNVPSESHLEDLDGGFNITSIEGDEDDQDLLTFGTLEMPQTNNHFDNASNNFTESQSNGTQTTVRTNTAEPIKSSADRQQQPSVNRSVNSPRNNSSRASNNSSFAQMQEQMKQQKLQQNKQAKNTERPESNSSSANSNSGLTKRQLPTQSRLAPKNNTESNNNSETVSLPSLPPL